MKQNDILYDSIKLVENVKKFPCIWNYTIQKYCAHDVLDNAWEEISKAMSDTPANLRIRWRAIRTGFLRGRKHPAKNSEGILVNSYYLAKYLTFLEPYVYARTNNCINQYRFLEEDNTTDNSVNYQEDQICDIVVEKQEVTTTSNESVQGEDTSDEAASNVQLYKKKYRNVGTSPLRISSTRMKRKITVADDGGYDEANNSNNNMNIHWVKKRRDKSVDTDGNHAFVYSLLPYLRNMTGKQNRRFQQKVIALIDNILEDADLPQMIFRTLPPGGSSAQQLGCSSHGNFNHSIVKEDKHFFDLTGDMH